MVIVSLSSCDVSADADAKRNGVLRALDERDPKTSKLTVGSVRLTAQYVLLGELEARWVEKERMRVVLSVVTCPIVWSFCNNGTPLESE